MHPVPVGRSLSVVRSGARVLFSPRLGVRSLTIKQYSLGLLAIVLAISYPKCTATHLHWHIDNNTCSTQLAS